MITASTKLSLAIQLAANYLQHLGLGTKTVNFNEETSVVRASIADDQDKITINVVGVGIEENMVMISLYQSKNSLGQALLDYDRDLEMAGLSFPVTYSEFLKSHGDVLQRIDSKFKLKSAVPQDTSSDQYGRIIPRSCPVGTTPPANLPRVSSEPNPPRRPSDMPDFEDEYQVRQELRIPGPQRPLRSYGDSDLYPMGQKNPLMGDPSLMAPPGGMMFDPMREMNRRREMEEMKNRGPGWMPGAKYDDPFGRPSFGGPGGPGPGSFT